MQALEKIIIEPTAQADYSLIWLHGLGADGHDFEPIAPELRLPNVRFIFPHAPVRRVTLNAGMAMRAWYDIAELSLNPRESEADILDSQQKIENLIEAEINKGVPANHIFLIGFSQGGAMALQIGLRYAKALAGIAVLSAYLPLRDKVEKELNSAQLNTPIFMAHGTFDMVLPYVFGEASKNALTSLGMKVEWHSYNMGHSVCNEEIAALRSFLHKIISY